jgi:NNP family nitrate/nitrite transporter-like MFS transporter
MWTTKDTTACQPLQPSPRGDRKSGDSDDRNIAEKNPLFIRSSSENALAVMSTSYGSTPSNRLLFEPPQASTALKTKNVVKSNRPQAFLGESYRLRPLNTSNNNKGVLECCLPKSRTRDKINSSDSEGDEDDSDDGDFEGFIFAKEELLGRAESFDLPHSADRGYRATAFKFCSISRPYMRAMHASWICFFASYSVQFAMAPLLPQLELSLNLTKQDIWLSNVWMVVGGIPMRFVLGPLCDSYGPRFVMCTMLLACSIPCALSGLIIFNLPTLLFVRFIIGSMDAFVPSQCWITTMFVREVTGTIMAIVAGLGASGSAFSQLLVGYLFDTWTDWTDGNAEAAWKLTLLFPAIFALIVAYWAYFYSDDCPLGNFVDVKRAGLMMERSAVDSFRSGVINLNSWLLFVQYAFSSGVDTTLCNGIAIYYHVTFHQEISKIGAIAFLYGFSALYARGLGGYISDKIGDRFSLSGRLWIHFCSMIAQGGMNIWFARAKSLNTSLVIMFVFAILIQMSTGTCFGIVPFVDSANTGSVAGIVGAGGNVGAVIMGLIFMYNEYEDAFGYMAYCTIGSALLTPLIIIKGYKGMLFGKDDHDDPTRKQHSPLMVPKMNHSPHFVKLRRKARGHH